MGILVLSLGPFSKSKIIAKHNKKVIREITRTAVLDSSSTIGLLL